MNEINEKSILVFRSANHPIVKECIQKINADFGFCNIWLCVQEQCTGKYADFLDLKLIVFPNGMFSFEKTISNEKICALLTKKRFSAIYIPHSMEISNYREIEKIVRGIIGEKRVLYYNAQGEIKRKKVNSSELTIRKVFKALNLFIDYCVIKAIYFCFTRRK